MNKIDTDFKLIGLDHVAINVRDLEVSSRWYQRVLGLTERKFEEWGDYPIFMLSSNFGVALFPADATASAMDPPSKSVKIDHFAFNVDNENFKKAIQKFKNLKIDHEIKDHVLFHSVYIHDPDGHTVELTTLVVPEKKVYL